MWLTQSAFLFAVRNWFICLLMRRMLADLTIFRIAAGLAICQTGSSRYFSDQPEAEITTSR